MIPQQHVFRSAGFAHSVEMNDIAEPVAAPPAAKEAVVRARDAASLILLRGEGRDLELLAGRRPRHVRFMPGVYVFPGGAVDRGDARPWRIETGNESLAPRLRRSARAALRETWEETGVLVGRVAAGASATGARPIETAYEAAGLVAAFDVLAYVGRAITPARVFRRFNTRFFLGDGEAVFGEPQSTDELEDVHWHPIGRDKLEPLRDVSRFMLARAIALRNGAASHPAPLFYTVNNTRRVGVCREAVL